MLAKLYYTVPQLNSTVPHIMTVGNNQMEDLSLDPTISPAEPSFTMAWEGKTTLQAAGMFWQHGFLSCGGQWSGVVTEKCFHLTLGASASVSYPSMNVPRFLHAFTIYQGRLWVTGGHSTSKFQNN